MIFEEVKMFLESDALWLGRFQPPTIAHLATLEAILAKWKRVTIGVVYNTPRPPDIDPRWKAYLQLGDVSSYREGKNPFNPHEVLTMWEACIRNIGSRCRVTLLATPRPQHDPYFVKRFADFELIMVEVSGEDAAIDQARHTLYPELLGLKVQYVKPRFKLHNSEIRQLIASGKKKWQEVLPQGTYEVFRAINGPCRAMEIGTPA